MGRFSLFFEWVFMTKFLIFSHDFLHENFKFNLMFLNSYGTNNIQVNIILTEKEKY